MYRRDDKRTANDRLSVGLFPEIIAKRHFGKIPTAIGSLKRKRGGYILRIRQSVIMQNKY